MVQVEAGGTPPASARGDAPALVIFDCDGVLVDSEPISLAVLTRALNGIGVDMDLDAVRTRFAGTSMASIMERVGRDYPVSIPEDFSRVVKQDTLDAFDRGLSAMEGVKDAIEGLPMPVCVASSSDPVRLRHSLGLTGLLPLFEERLFSSSMVARGKPFPDLFLFAAAQMRAEPAACLVIEDSVPGVRAAKAAGMRVIGFTGGGHWQHDRAGSDLLAAGAESVFRDYRALQRVIMMSWDSII